MALALGVERCATARDGRVCTKKTRSRARSSSRCVARASTSGKVGIGYSAAGFFFGYHCGVWETLVENGVMESDTPVAGSSAGALVAALHACGFSPADGKRILGDVVATCRDVGVVGKVGAILEDTLRRELPADAHERCSKNNLFIAVSSPKITFGGDEKSSKNSLSFELEGELVSEFESFDDLVSALLTSCHIPFYCGWPARRFRNKWSVDGGWYDLTPTPPNTDSNIRVCAFPLLDAWRKAKPGTLEETGDFFAQQASFWAGWGDDDTNGKLIAPDAAGGAPDLDYNEAIRYALLPGDDEILEQLVVMGRKDARRWVESSEFSRNIVRAT